MVATGLTCTICSEFYKNSEEIFTTRCGHLFHSRCIQEWRSRSSTCPQCRSYATELIRVFLNFEQCPTEKEKEISELKSEIEKFILNASLLQQQLDASERDLLQAQNILSNNEKEIKDLNKKIEYLNVQNESRIKAIEMKTIEIHKLQEALNKSTPQGSCLVLQEEIKTLKQKLSNISSELEKEIRNSTNLTVEKMKLQGLLDYYQKSSDLKKEQNEKYNKNTSQRRFESKGNASLSRNYGCIQSVIIKNVRGPFIDETALKDFVLKLIRIMELNLKSSDIENVSVFERKDPEKMSLLVKFTSQNLKVMFLSHKDRLKRNDETNNIIVYEFVGDNTKSLFHYAKGLKELGYKHVYCRNNKVFVRKDDGAETFRINSQKDVDELKKKCIPAKDHLEHLRLLLNHEL